MKTGVFGTLLSPKSIERTIRNSSKTEKKRSEAPIELPKIKHPDKDSQIDIILNQDDIKVYKNEDPNCYTTTFSKMPSKTSMVAVMQPKCPEIIACSEKSSSFFLMGTPVFKKEYPDDATNFTKKTGLQQKVPMTVARSKFTSKSSLPKMNAFNIKRDGLNSRLSQHSGGSQSIMSRMTTRETSNRNYELTINH